MSVENTQHNTTARAKFSSIFIFISVFIFLFSFQTTAQITIWSEDFESYTDNTGIDGTGNIGDYPASVSKWTIDASNVTLSNRFDFLKVNTGYFQGRDLDGVGIWQSEGIDISIYEDVEVSAEFWIAGGTMEPEDSINFYYRLDEGGWIAIVLLNDDFSTIPQSHNVLILNGSSLELKVEILNDGRLENYAFDNVSVQGTAIVSDPSTFTTTALSVSEIDLNWTPNVDNDDVLLAWSSDGNFGIPSNGTVYSSGNVIPGGGTVLYYGSNQQFSHINLSEGTQYFYKVWSYNGLLYSPGVTDDETTLCNSNPLALPWLEDFESVGPTLTFTSNQTSISGLCYWEYEKTINGRLQFSVGSPYSGTRAATVDANPGQTGTLSENYLTATLDLSYYASSTDLELRFWIYNYGEEEHANDRVWIRGSSTDSWIEIYELHSVAEDQWVEVSGLDIDNAISSAGQEITSTFQLRFGQEDDWEYQWDGWSIDDIQITGTIPCVATATISGDTTVCPNAPVDLTVDLTGTPPWNISYTNGTDTFPESGINSSPHTISVSTDTTTTYTLVNISDANCTGTVSGSAVVTIEDTENPTITCATAPVGGYSNDPGECFYTVPDNSLDPTVTDNCGVDSVANDFNGLSTLQGAQLPVDDTSVTWTVFDAAGNSANCIQRITVNDDEDPVITCPPDVTVAPDSGETSATDVDLGVPDTSDNCGISSVINNGSEPYNLGTTTVTWLVTDNSGNSVICQQQVTVTETGNTIILTSAAGTDNQTVCQNSPIVDIIYATTGATGATFSGLPDGVTGTWAADTVIISGTPTESGTFNYTVTLTGGSDTGSTTGTITVNPLPNTGEIIPD